MKKNLLPLVMILSLALPASAAAPDVANNGMSIPLSIPAATVQLPSNAELAKLAGATNTAMFDIHIGDKSFEVLTKIFGPEIFTQAGGMPGFGKNIVQDMMGVWNVAVMVLGVIFLGYIVAVGIVKTAHEGEVLGKQWSSIWIPLRTSLGFTMILPIKSYCVAQIMVMWLTTVGVGLADGLWAMVAANLQVSHAAIIKPVVTVGKDKTEFVWTQLVCQAAMEKEYVGYTPGFIKFDKLNDLHTSHLHGFTYGDTSGKFPADTCGGFSWGSYNFIATQAEVTLSGGVGTVDSTKLASAGAVADAIIDAQQTALLATSNYLWPYAKIFVGTGSPAKGDFLSAAAATYDTVMQKNFDNATKLYLDAKVTDMNKNMIADGWIMAGAYFMKMIALNNELIELAHAQPESISVNAASVGPIVGPLIAGHIDAGREYLQAYNQQHFGSGVGNAYKQEIGIKDNTDSSVWAAVRHPFMGLQQGMAQMLVTPDQHPIIALQNMGNRLIDAWYIMQGAKIAAAVATEGESSAAFSGISKLAGGDTTSGVVNWLMTGLVAGAIIMAVIIPMMPFIIWMIDVLGWLLAVVVSVVAAPVWMVMHMFPEGHEMTGYGARGYTLLLSVAMKPALMVISLIFAMILSWVSINLVAEGWMFAFSAANSGVVVGPILGIGGFVLFCIFLMMMVYKTFSFIHGIQNSVLEWVGGRDHDLVGAGRAAEVIAGAGAAMAMKATGLGRSINEARGNSKDKGSAAEKSREKAAQSSAEASIPLSTNS